MITNLNAATGDSAEGGDTTVGTVLVGGIG